MSSDQMFAHYFLTCIGAFLAIPAIGREWSEARWFYLAAAFFVAPAVIRLYLFAVLG